MQFIDPNGVPPSPDLPPERIAVRDNGLAARLRDEWPAILRWAIDGLFEWVRREVACMIVRRYTVCSAISCATSSLTKVKTCFSERMYLLIWLVVRTPF
jgi:hypothetical protein